MMAGNVEAYLEQLVDGQRKQAERDGIYETTVIHGEKIKSLTNQQCRQDENCKGQHELIWTKMRERKKEAVDEAEQNTKLATQKLKIWIMTALLSGAGALVLAVFAAFFKTQGGP